MKDPNERGVNLLIYVYIYINLKAGKTHTKSMANALNRRIPENIFKGRKCKRQADSKNPKNIFLINNAYHQRQQLYIIKNN